MDSRFRWLWAAYAVSAYGSGLGFGALALVAVLVLDAGPAHVALLSAAGPAVGALVALSLGPWVERRAKRPVLVAMDLVRFAALLSIPLAHLAGRLTFAQLLVVSATIAAAKIAFTAATAAVVKAVVPPGSLIAANARFESTTWSAIAVGPPLGGAAVGVFGPMMSVMVDAVSYLLSAVFLTGIGHARRPSSQPMSDRLRLHDLLDGWRHLWSHPGLRPLFLNNLLVNGLIMATEPLLAVLLLRHLGFSPFEYGLAFAAPCLGGLIGSRLAGRVVARHGRRRILRVVGTLRAVWLIGLAFVPAKTGGLATVIAVEFAIIVSMSLYNPVLAAYRLEHTPAHLVARTMTAWSVGTGAAIAALSALGGLLAAATGPRTALATAGALILLTPLLLLRAPVDSPAPAPDHTLGSRHTVSPVAPTQPR